ncbi:MAG: thiamine phosphate synthase [Acidobacteriota bacterium]
MRTPPLEFPPVYPITPDALRGEALRAWAESLIGAGCAVVQFRRKSGADEESLADLRDLVGLARPSSCRVIVDDRVDLCLLAEADGVHLGQADLPVPEARVLLGRDKIIGYSTHNLEQFEQALDLPLDYVALGPVYPTATKADPDPVVPPLVQREVIARSPWPVVAIGGITAAKAETLWRRGFSSVAVVSALRERPAESFREFLSRHRVIPSRG